MGDLFSICQTIRSYSVRQHNGKDLWKDFIFFPLPIKSQGASWYNPYHMFLDIFREGVHTWTTNSDSLCNNAYFSPLSYLIHK